MAQSTAMMPTLAMETKIQRTEWIWLMITGVCLVLLGFGALSMPVVVSVGAELFIGAMLVVGGVVQFVQALRKHKHSGFWYSVTTGVLIAIMGALLLAFPVVGMATLTMMITAYLLVAGVFKTIYGFQLRPLQGWGWIVTSGVFSLILSAMLLYRFPVSALVVLGVFIGVDLIAYGIAEIGLAFEWRKVSQAPT